MGKKNHPMFSVPTSLFLSAIKTIGVGDKKPQLRKRISRVRYVLLTVLDRLLFSQKLKIKIYALSRNALNVNIYSPKHSDHFWE
jgi:hypothetical protein